MENETPSRPGWTGRHPHTRTHTDPLRTPCRRLLCVSLYVKSYSTISPYPQTVPNNSPNVRSINVNKMDATAYPETRPICWIESDRTRERKRQNTKRGWKKPVSNRNCIAKIVTKLCRWFMLPLLLSLLLLFALCGSHFLLRLLLLSIFCRLYWFSQMAACEN